MDAHNVLRVLPRSKAERSKFHAGSPNVRLKRYRIDCGGKKTSGAPVRRRITLAVDFILILGWVNVGSAGQFVFSTGNPDGQIATLSRTASTGKLETETADDFVTTATTTTITNATFTGLLVGGATTADIHNVEIELYHVFPVDSTNPPDNRVLTRMNSPSDNNFAAADGTLGQLSFTTTVLNANFTAANSVVNGINPIPNQFTGGEGGLSGKEVQFNITFNTPFVLGPDHVFFRPEVDLGAAGDFLWLSAPKPIVAPGTPFASDLQSWIRNDGAGALAPDWERIGTDVTHQGPFNAAFSLSGTTVPEPSTPLLLGLGALVLLGYSQQRMARTWKNLWSNNHS
jgi:PEP-CTERM motif